MHSGQCRSAEGPPKGPAGSGGGGAKTSLAGANGGSGIVLIKYQVFKSDSFVINSTTTSVIVDETKEENTRIFKYDSTTGNGDYSITFDTDVVADILIVGGGGGGCGSGYECGGGGGGGVLYMINVPFKSGELYKIKVADGGASNQKGQDSGIKYSDDTDMQVYSKLLIGRGGGPGLGSNSYGGSGGGGRNRQGNKTGAISLQGMTFWDDEDSEYVQGGFKGANGGTYHGGGGGGAGAAGTRNGGDGREIDITGTNVYYGGGGGASSGGNGGLGGGGDAGRNFWGNSVGIPGEPHTGGGGGSQYARHNRGGGKGGSGIVVIKYR